MKEKFLVLTPNYDLVLTLVLLTLTFELGFR